MSRKKKHDTGQGDLSWTAGYEVIFTLDAPKGVLDLSRVEELEYYEEDDTKIDRRYGGLAPRQKGMMYKLYPVMIDPEKAKGMSILGLGNFAD